MKFQNNFKIIEKYSKSINKIDFSENSAHNLLLF